jgi:hypothetical protein
MSIVGELQRILRQYDCRVVRNGKGSHVVWESPFNGKRMIVSRSESRHTANGVLKQAGIPARL